MVDGVIGFMLGFVIGVFIGLVLAALMVASGRQSDAERKRDEGKQREICGTDED